MRKREIHDYDLRNAKLIFKGESCKVLRLNNGSVLKIFDPMVIELSKTVGADIEAKILDAVPIKQSPEILVPTAAAYRDDNFIGYTMPMARGIDYNSYYNDLTFFNHHDLHKFALVHSRLEGVLRRNPNMVFPDFCTFDNIFIDDKENVQFIDYDGIQVGKHKSLSMSTSLGSITEHMANPKYFTSEQWFTKELDKKSSIISYFLTTFNVRLDVVGKANPIDGKIITVDEIFNYINLDDPDVCHKVWKLFQDNQQNEYLGDDVFKIAEKYNMVIDGRDPSGAYSKYLMKKR